jgi:hypothetical protein
MRFKRTGEQYETVQENNKKQFTGRSSSSSEKAVQVGVQEPSQPSHLVGPGRRVGQLVPEGFKELPVLSKSC